MEPVLWHITISPYSEKVRWALDYKSISYRTRAPVPGIHIPVALWLTRGKQYTFPVIDINGERIGDSTAIIAELEERFPDARLYPSEREDRESALALEDWFDEKLGPYVRRFGFHELLRDPECFAEVGALAAPGAFRHMGSSGQAFARTMIGMRYRASSDEASELARQKVISGFEHLESRLDGGDYLVGESFTVADLTAASLFYPVVRPPESYVTIERMPEPVEQLREELRDRRGFQWVEEMYRRHRLSQE